MSNVLKITTLEELRCVLDNSDDVVVNFSAPAWCKPCQRLYPHFEAAAGQHPNIDFVYVDVDPEGTGMIMSFEPNFTVLSVPTVIRVKGGKKKEVNSRTAPALIRELS